jgi:tetratricopeptide (TPR) repeat protein
MSSHIEGFSYDIFISYRQKDNKYDGWVTEFVENLKRELEATFKDEINIYFDMNPHDGLLETHDVGASLKEKLKCLVFIPIISRTYCDPRSFAWEHEFKAFVEQASRDQFGIKVTIPSGNVASRVLPIRIHDIDNNDIKQCESVLGTVLRGVDFIYKSAGVNRPLRSKEDNPHDNLNNYFYRDQINKVSLAVKDIIESMITPVAIDRVKERESPVRESTKKKKPAGEGKLHLKKPHIFVPGGLIVIIIVIFITFSSSNIIPFEKRDWIVITDFENQTDDPVFDKSLYSAFYLTTSQSRYINVLPRSRMLETLTRMETKEQVYIDDKTGREIAVREGIGIYIVPSISEVGNRYVIAAKIMETKSGDLLRSEILYSDSKDMILATLDQLARKIRRNLGESRYRIVFQDKPLSKATTSSLEALKLYSMGVDCHLISDFTGAKDYYESALRVDTGFTAAKASLGNLLIERFDPPKGRELLRQAIKSVDNLTDREKLGILTFYAVNVENDLAKGIEYARMRIELYPDDPVARNNLGWYYQFAGQFEDALKEYQAAVNIDPDMALAYSGLLWILLEKLGQPDSAMVWSEKMISENPQNGWGYTYLGSAYICFDSLTEAEFAFNRARELDPELIFSLYRLAHTYRLLNRYEEAIGILKEIEQKNQYEYSVYYDLGVNYEKMGDQDEAHKNFSVFKEIINTRFRKKYPDDAGTYLTLSAVMARLGERDSSLGMLQKAIDIDSTLHSRFADVLCLQGKNDDALNQLEKALNNGYRDLCWLKLDPDLQSLQYESRFNDLIDKFFR